MDKREKIETDFLGIKNTNDELLEIASSLNDENNMLRMEVAGLSGNWTGDAYTTFRRKAEGISDRIDEVINGIRSSVENIGTNATRLRDAELEAIEIAEKEAAEVEGGVI